VKFQPSTIRIVLILISVSLAPAAGADERKRLQLVREISLKALIDEAAGTERHAHSVSQLKFSDDDRWIAVDLVAGHYGGFEIQKHHLLLLSNDLKAGTAEQFDFDYRKAGGDGSAFFLSADASLVAVEDGLAIDILDRRNRSSCSVAPSVGDGRWLALGGFLNAELVLVTRYRPGAEQSDPTTYEVYDRGCKLRDAWELSGGYPATASPLAHGLFVRRYLGGTQWETELLEWPAWRPSGKWPFWRRGLAADSGRVLCFESFAASDNSPIECRDLGSGTSLAKQVVIHGAYPLAVAASGTLAVANDWFKLWKPFTEGDYWVHVKRQVLWDFRSGQVLASWIPTLQKDNAGKWKGFTIERFPFVCALSHTGAFIAEAGDEKIRTSRILGQKP